MEYPSFSKYQQSGNDFIIFDDRSFAFPKNDQQFISRLCDRKFGIGADGVILLQTSNKCDFCMRIFNSDGKEAESCGNGICCLARFIKDQNLTKSSEATFELIESSVKVLYQGHTTLVQMDKPTQFEFNQTISFKDKSLTYHFVNTGVPHFVTFVNDLKKIDVKKIGSFIRNHSNFVPFGTNVNFALVKNEHEIHVRTYERGVESETLACGTGACAVALIASFVYTLSSPIKIFHPGGSLTVHFRRSLADIQNVTIVGMAQKIYSGCLSMNYNYGDAVC